jgi:glycosyltransferase involved in cell wall biosynthesis
VTGRQVSIVLPVHNQADHIEPLVGEYMEALEGLPIGYELILVPNGCRDDSASVCARLSDASAGAVQTVELERSGWGAAVRAGLKEATGEQLCFTNSARTPPQLLAVAVTFANVYPNVVVKAQRTIRDNRRRRVGSLVYNLECRVLFDLSTWDINGTPKIFPRSFRRLLELTRDDDLLDAEFVAVCRRERYPIVEIPALVTVRHGGRSTTSLRSAVRMYTGAFRLRREFRQDDVRTVT